MTHTLTGAAKLLDGMYNPTAVAIRELEAEAEGSEERPPATLPEKTKDDDPKTLPMFCIAKVNEASLRQQATFTHAHGSSERV